MSKLNPRGILRIIILAMTLLAGLVAVRRIAQANCQNTGSGSHDVVNCTPPSDTTSIQTGYGNDTVTLQAGVEFYAPEIAILMGQGNDVVNLYGALSGGIDGIALGPGSDELHNYGYLQGANDAVTCNPQPGQRCTIHNYSSGTITAGNEAVDIVAAGGSALVQNEGRIASSNEEAIHLRFGSRFEVVNSGMITGADAGIEVFSGQAIITNSGTITAYGDSESGLNLDTGDDTVVNTGTITVETDPAISTGGGNDLVENHGTITARNDVWNMSAIETEDGNDRIINSGTISELGIGNSAIEAGHGSDVVIIQGGAITGLINGDHEAGGRSTDHDILVFEFDGEQAQLDAFRASVEDQSPRDGSASWQGNTYTWQGFEEIHLNLNGSMPDAGTIAETTPVDAGSSSAEDNEDSELNACPTTVPDAVRSEESFSQPDSGVVMLQWEDSADECMAVESYTVVAFYGDYLHEWTFYREEISCNGTSCQATITVSADQPRFYWYVTASNAVGAGSARNIRLLGYAP